MARSAPATMRAWRTHRYGSPAEALHLDEVDVPEPGDGEVLVRVHAAPLNLNDLERVTGGNMMVEPELPYSPGMETLGVVEAAGPGAESLLGTRVAATTRFAYGGFAEYVICPAASAFDMPDTIGLPDAACLYFPFHLAWLGLFDRAELRAGESVLIHAAAGGSGSAAIQLAKHRGARVFATVGSDTKKALCDDLGADVVVNYETEDFAQVVLDETQGRGVDVVFDNVGAAVLDKSIAVTAYNGRYPMMGFASDKAVADVKFIVPRRVIMANMKLCGVVLAYQEDATVPSLKEAVGFNFLPTTLGRKVHRRIVELVLEGAVRPVVGSVVDFEHLPAALTAMANRETTGRTVVMVDP